MAKNENTKNKGAAASTTTPKTKVIKGNFNDNSKFNQRLKLLDWLLEKGSITTAQARQHLDVMRPAGRCKELRDAGYLLNTVWDSWTSEYGIKHRIARYVLSKKVPVEAVNDSEAAA